MKKMAACFCLVALSIALGACSDTTEPAPKEASSAVSDRSGPEATGRKVVEALVAGNWAASVVDFDATMKANMTEAQMEALWGQLTTLHGAFKKITGVEADKADGYDLALVSCAFERGSQVIQVTVDTDGKVAGLFLR